MVVKRCVSGLCELFPLHYQYPFDAAGAPFVGKDTLIAERRILEEKEWHILRDVRHALGQTHVVAFHIVVGIVHNMLHNGKQLQAAQIVQQELVFQCSDVFDPDKRSIYYGMTKWDGSYRRFIAMATLHNVVKALRAAEGQL